MLITAIKRWFKDRKRRRHNAAMSEKYAEDREKARAYEAARQHYIRQSARREREERKKRERRENFRVDVRVAIYFVFFIFAAVYMIQNLESVLAWWEHARQEVMSLLFGSSE